MTIILTTTTNNKSVTIGIKTFQAISALGRSIVGVGVRKSRKINIFHINIAKGGIIFASHKMMYTVAPCCLARS